MPCSNAAKTRNQLKFAGVRGVPQTGESISAVSGPKFAILCGNVEEVLLLNKFFYRASYASAVLGVVILSVRLSHACFVTNPKNRPALFLYYTKRQSF